MNRSRVGFKQIKTSDQNKIKNGSSDGEEQTIRNFNCGALSTQGGPKQQELFEQSKNEDGPKNSSKQDEGDHYRI